jgi:hypothetical protein
MKELIADTSNGASLIPLNRLTWTDSKGLLIQDPFIDITDSILSAVRQQAVFVRDGSGGMPSA